MNRSSIFITTAICVSSLSACDAFKDKYDAGYDDGWAAGYNTTCKIRATMIEGDWDSESYSNGYSDGYTDGSYECRNQK